MNERLKLDKSDFLQCSEKVNNNMTTSEQINDATQTRFFPRGKKKPDLPDDRPPVYVILLIPFILLLIKLCDVYDWISSKKW